MWLSARADAQAAARHALSNMNAVLDEARHAQETARAVVDRGCSQDGQYRLGTEAALRPHLRTILILRQGNVVCSSLVGNRALLTHVPDLPERPLQLVSADESAEGKPVLLSQARYAVKGNAGQVRSEIYPFAITFSQPPFFIADRFFRNGGVILAFLLIVSGFAAYLLYRFMNKTSLPEETLRLAIARGQIVPFYQPVVDGRDGPVRGVEVQARWKHPTAGYISPSAFIPLAEKSGQIVPLTHSLMTQVIGHMNILTEKLPEGYHISLNFSASHITSPTFEEECLHFRSGFTRQDLNLVIEVTEREPLDMNEGTIRTLNGLHEKGFGIALDDFGTGYSGLSYLDTLDIDYIKIDSTFVSRVNASAESTVILDVVLDLARKLSIRIVAEGVETREQADYLRHNHVVFMQGYYYFRPVSLQGLAMILLSRPRVRLVGAPP
ncbi:EAL domain-containing protein [Klebsiella quasipneumoniae]|uniref:EAL domain-containing protein n=1 Tax=Klebsiella quasipneumoniae TaxID=1463165 RepID=UPI00351BD9F5